MGLFVYRVNGLRGILTKGRFKRLVCFGVLAKHPNIPLRSAGINSTNAAEASGLINLTPDT